MKSKFLLSLTIVLLQISSFLGGIENSVVPLVEKYENLVNFPSHKFSKPQFEEIQQVLTHKNARLRIVSYNMLSDDSNNEHERGKDKQYNWKSRLLRIMEVFEEMQPDIIAVQELSERQVNDLLPLMQETYEFYGYPRNKDQEFNGFFYRKSRFVVELHKIMTVYESGSITNTLTALQLKDKTTQKKFAVFNTHLPFSSPNQRELEVQSALKLMQPFADKMPILFMGDLNTFPNRLDLDLPFYDGDYLHRLLTEKLFQDASDVAILGNFGPLATYTNDSRSILPFRGQGTPGVILDHIYVSDKVQVLVHAVQPATVNKLYPSDHMPIFIDFLLK